MIKTTVIFKGLNSRDVKLSFHSFPYKNNDFISFLGGTYKVKSTRFMRFFKLRIKLLEQ
jgi:hypothetical protein